MFGTRVCRRNVEILFFFAHQRRSKQHPVERAVRWRMLAVPENFALGSVNSNCVAFRLSQKPVVVDSLIQFGLSASFAS